MNRVYICSCFGITEQQVRQHADDGRCTPRQIASACKAGTDCGSCVKRIQALLGRGAVRVAAGPQVQLSELSRVSPVSEVSEGSGVRAA
ncbi:bacterioferritin-associated ferredoxin [Streptomyces polygonati]|uniref:Bacterioferritin-associated ferredoxin n=1 Tax=Streptomyces polygonati TaxID=1617087 RepID=A0ABV8HFR2_9ACTN